MRTRCSTCWPGWCRASAVHRRRLAEALARASAGETDYVSGVRVASYHTVWFELHEDLLRLLGRTREP